MQCNQHEHEADAVRHGATNKSRQNPHHHMSELTGHVCESTSALGIPWVGLVSLWATYMHPSVADSNIKSISTR